MERLVKDTNKKLKEIVKELKAIKNDYENKIKENKVQMDEELKKVKEYKEEFITSKEKIDKMKADIEGFEADYQNLVDRFKNDELANILVTANKEISAKIDERKRKIMMDKAAMNEIVEKAEDVKKNLVSLTGERKILESECQKVTDIYNFYNDNLTAVITYAHNNADDLANKVAITIAKEEVAPDVIDIYVDRGNTNTVDVDNIDLDKVFSSSIVSDIVDNETETNAYMNNSKKEEEIVVEDNFTQNEVVQDNFISEENKEDIIIQDDSIQDNVTEEETFVDEISQDIFVQEEPIQTDVIQDENNEESFLSEYPDDEVIEINDDEKN